ncbi:MULTISPECIES: hypothetical protein [unclassified Shewanella]|uniref:hypothetical protein n=1 Tax=unclassified Shewanella TaxID=196818 RepID=UPI000C7BEE71|nr:MULTISPECIES: hypothetical protein [unclassified Shewanella]PKG57615.1 hypothetical protein CXF82_08770 [Shewanella sp. GutDb-MelDb]PKG73304.1 hypothetical protein CXF86_17770 [Shewanella sp. GutCb]
MNGFTNAAMAWLMMFPTSMIPIAGRACAASFLVFIANYLSYCFLDADKQSLFLIPIVMSAISVRFPRP